MFTFFYAFDIEFFSKGQIYTAKVHKVPSENPLAKEYHVFHVRPEIPNAPSSLTFVYHRKESTFDCKIFKGDRHLSKNIAISIKKYCDEHEIQLA